MRAALLHGPHHRRNIPFVEQYRKSGVFDFLGCCFRYCRGISLLSRQSPEIYRHVMKVLARRLRDTNNAQLVGQFTDIVFDVAAGGGN
jgi:CRP-like cAMP-binding protein